MMRYRNARNGAVIETDAQVSGGGWELIPAVTRIGAPSEEVKKAAKKQPKESSKKRGG